ncbi:hypothetical protein [Candidatus Entotheonella palauensis]|uniref:Uncharacterized protein n=1 Tax=Candidatus Entotheonella gemina TaxID=1429439 RepID=W4MCN0_9BACT|nr:hypothetical protein [Candidatus Entotheonella palauensis]ETX07372.1 MAG: hypothetical protein ETSY2_11595 [Candidatus Entotheonella gemina]
MALDIRSINKLMKEGFDEASPMHVDPAERESLGEKITQQLTRIEGVDTKAYHYMSEAEKSRLVCTFSIADPDSRYFYMSRNNFRLVLDESNVLTLKTERHGSQAIVSDIDEIPPFVMQIKQRLARRQAQRVKREKIRDLKAQAIIAQVKQLAKTEQFDFMTQTDSQKLKLFVKLSDRDSIEIHIPFNQFQTSLPQLRTTITSLRELHASGLRFKITSGQGRLWRAAWVSHQSL